MKPAPLPACGFAFLLLAGALPADPPRPNPSTSPRANVVFILADDLGWTDLGAQGSTYYQTPNIDRLAAQGLRFTDGYTCGPNCQPTRAALLSGQYAPRTGIYTVGGIDRFNWRSRPLRPVENVTALPPGTVTIAQTLRQAGYTTALIGKWHIGEQAHPLDRGFDEFFGFLGGGHDYFTDAGLRRGRTPVSEESYLTDAFAREAESFIRRHRDRPFFLYLAPNAVHTPLQAPPERVARFKDRPAAGGHGNATYAAMLSSLDDAVGRVVGLLDELGLSTNTLVIFSSDNGGVGGYRREHIQAEDITDNAPLRGGKGMLYEGGVRVPFIFSWPGQIAAGTTSAVPIISVDLYPTLLELAGGPHPTGQPLDGTSLLDLLRGEPVMARPPLYWHFPGYLGAGGATWRTTPAGAIRDGDWKLLEFFETGRGELYNLKSDPGQRVDLAAAEPAKAADLKGKLHAWRQSVHAPMPTPHRSDSATTPPKRKKEKKGAAP